MDRNERILEAAMRVYSRYGRQKANVQDIADAAGVSKKTIYNHFGNRTELFDRTIHWNATRIVAFYAELHADKDLAIPDKIAKAVGFALDQFEFKHCILNGDLRQYINPYLKESPIRFVQGNIARSIEILIEQAQEQGLCRTDHPPETLARVILIMVNGLMSIDGITEDFRTGKTLSETAIGILLQSVLTEEGRKLLPRI